jgi:hypothetical protein
MIMNRCQCGRAVTLRVRRINSRQGVGHWISHRDGPDVCCGTYECQEFHPFANYLDRPYIAMIQRWNEANPAKPPAPTVTIGYDPAFELVKDKPEDGFYRVQAFKKKDD